MPRPVAARHTVDDEHVAPEPFRRRRRRAVVMRRLRRAAHRRRARRGHAVREGVAVDVVVTWVD
jgi:hypothetical protein